MPQNKATIIISSYEGNNIDWGIITGKGLRAALASFQSGKKMLSVITHFLTVLYPAASLSSRRALSIPPPPRKQREKLTTLIQEPWEEPTPPSPPAAAQNPTSVPPPPTKTQKQRAFPDTSKEWDEDAGTEDNVGRGCYYSTENATTLDDSPTTEPAPHHSGGNITTDSETQAGRGTNTTGPKSPNTAKQETTTQP